MTTTDTTVNNLIINTMTQAQYNQITPSSTELYMVTDEAIINYIAQCLVNQYIFFNWTIHF